MIPKPLTETQVLNRLSFYASSGVSADAFPVANACRWLTLGPDDETVIARWPEILGQFTHSFRTANPTGLRIPLLAHGSHGNIRGYMPGLVEVLRLWCEAKSKVLGAPANTVFQPTPTSPSTPSPTMRRLIGGSLGEPAEKDDEDSVMTSADCPVQSPGPGHPAICVETKPCATAPAFFTEVVVRPAKLTCEQSAVSSLINPTALETAEREAADADALLAEMLGAAATRSNPNHPNLS